VIGMFFLKVESRMMEELDEDHPNQIAMRFFEKNLSGVLPFDISVRSKTNQADRLKDPDVLKAMEGLQKVIEAHPSVSKTISLADFLKQMNFAVHEGEEGGYKLPGTREAAAQYLLLFSMGEKSGGLEDIVLDDYSWGRVIIFKRDWGTRHFFILAERINEHINNNFPPDIEARITGSSFIASRGIDNIVRDMVSSTLSSMLVISFVMMLLFRSIKLGLLSMIPNLIPIIATIGFMGFYGIHLRIATVVIFGVALGIAVDNTIHFLARFRDEFQCAQDYEEATRRTLMNTGRALIFSWFILSAGIGIVLMSNFVALRDFAILTIMTISMALAGAVVVMPALLLIFKPIREKISS
jgi:predicted RND superfamily exporter protein